MNPRHRIEHYKGYKIVVTNNSMRIAHANIPRGMIVHKKFDLCSFECATLYGKLLVDEIIDLTTTKVIE
jgi:hypothetical protein